MMGFSVGIPERASSSLSTGTRIASGSFTSDFAHCCGFRVSTKTKSSLLPSAFAVHLLKFLERPSYQSLLSRQSVLLTARATLGFCSGQQVLQRLNQRQ